MPVLLSFIALVFSRSPAACEALKSFKLLQLPSVRTLKHYIDANLKVAGECLQRLEDERKHYLDMMEKKRVEIETRRSQGKSCISEILKHFKGTNVRLD